MGENMVDMIEAKDWTMLNAAFVVDVKSLEDLKKVAEGLRAPFIFVKGKESVIFAGQGLATVVCYRFKA